MEASKPVLLTVDDDPGVSRAVARDLRKHYGQEFRIVRAESGRQALEALREIRLRGDPVAVLLADYRMPEMSGLEFLEQAMDLFPHARRALLTAYADTDAAIQAINVIDLDHYLLKPWEPPDEKLYPVVDELIELWRAAEDKPVTATQVVGHRWSARSYEVRDFLARNSVSYRWLTADQPEGRSLLAAAGLDETGIPLVVTPEGDSLVDPSVEEPAGRPARAPGSRTTSASPTGSAAPSSPTGPAGRRPSSGPRSSPRPPSPASRREARPGWSASPTAARSPPTPSCSPPGSATTPSTPPGSRSSPAAGSSTGRPRPRPRPAPARTSTWSAGPMRPARRPCSWPGTPARSPWWSAPTALSGPCHTT